MFAALIELNEKLKEEGIKNIELNVVGGFALMAAGLRGADEYTDIDYVGPALSKQVVDIAGDIGYKYGLTRAWINNEVLLSGSTLQGMEFTTGELHFHNAFEMESLKINILDNRDLLKMKVLAIDSSLCGINKDYSDFTRAKDLVDIMKLKDALHVSNIDIKEMWGDLIINDYTMKVIKAFEMEGIDRVKALLPDIIKDNSIPGVIEASNKSGKSGLLDNYLNDLFDLNRYEKKQTHHIDDHGER